MLLLLNIEPVPKMINGIRRPDHCYVCTINSAFFAVQYVNIWAINRSVSVLYSTNVRGSWRSICRWYVNEILSLFTKYNSFALHSKRLTSSDVARQLCCCCCCCDNGWSIPVYPATATACSSDVVSALSSSLLVDRRKVDGWSCWSGGAEHWLIQLKRVYSALLLPLAQRRRLTSTDRHHNIDWDWPPHGVVLSWDVVEMRCCDDCCCCCRRCRFSRWQTCCVRRHCS